MRLALISLDQAWQDRDANLLRCRALAREAAGQGCSVAVFPEMTLSGYTLDMDRVAEPAAASASLAAMGQLAAEVNMTLVFGASLLQPGPALPMNSLCVAHAGGRVEVVYEKLHPFSFAGEHTALRAGQRLGRAQLGQTGQLRLGCTVCYDLRFPEVYSLLAPSCNAVVNIANWPARRVAHWRALLVARAIENQYFVFGVNRTGVDGNGIAYTKSSMAVGPDGDVLEPLLAGPECDIYEIDLALVEAARAAFPTVADKRFSLYKELYQGVQ